MTTFKIGMAAAAQVHRTAGEWAAAVNQLWHSPTGGDLIAQGRATGTVAGVAISRERVSSREDDRTVLISHDFAWTVLLDPVSGDWRAL